MEHVVPWLSLKSVPGIGNLLFNRLVNQLGSPGEVFRASIGQLAGVKGMTPRLADAVQQHKTPGWVFEELNRSIRKGFQIITRHDPAYPRLLKHIPDPPPVLYLYGRLDGSDCHIAVVGSRKATTYGRNSARRLSQELVSRGVSVVSGMARGIDTAAHIGALNSGGPTVAVLGSGLTRIYPVENRKLFHRIAETGAVISEFTLNAEPAAHHFPQRNRIISGMSLGTVVVEATKRSGSLITARLAAEQGREVYAVPGSIHAATARGTHNLIKQGAKLVENADDILEELGSRMVKGESQNADTAMAKKSASFSALELKVLEAIGPYPIHIDELARHCRHAMGPLTAILSRLELKGAIFQEPGKFFVRNADGNIQNADGNKQL